MKRIFNSAANLLRNVPFRIGVSILTSLAAFGIANVQSAASLPPEVALAAEPLYSKQINAKPTLTLALSVEFPTVGAQYVSSPGATQDDTYKSANEYIGYFDTDSCYKYDDNVDVKLRRFYRYGAATNRTCDAAGFSGNFMNWATSSAIDVLRLALTGGDRVYDTPTFTILQRAVIPTGSGSFWNGANFPSKKLVSALVKGTLPDALVGSYKGDVYIANCLNRVHFGTAAEGNCYNPGNNSNLGVASGTTHSSPTTYTSTIRINVPNGPYGSTACASEGGLCTFAGTRRIAYGTDANGGGYAVVIARNSVSCNNTEFGDPISGYVKACYIGPEDTTWSPSGSGISSDKFFYSRVSVCDADASGNLTDPRSTTLCRKYPNGNFKPIGNLQRHSDDLRVAAFGYLNDSRGNPNERYGGVLRAPMKYVGERSYDKDFQLQAGTNTKQEWDADTGVFLQNPDGARGVTSGPDSNWPNETVSGVINYLNQFGRTGANFGVYKTYDPVGELYYEALRYLQGLPPTAAATADPYTTDMKDGYPVYEVWEDPHPPVTKLAASDDGYKCVKNNIVVIGDVNTHDDKSFPGNTRTSNGDFKRAASDIANEPDFHFWTQIVGGFESNSRLTYFDGKGVAQNTTNPNPPNTARAGMADQDIGADSASYYMAGAAYWANTHDIRGAQWTSSPEKQRKGMRVSTYVVDVNEFGQQTAQSAHENNQFFLASKYGGFNDVTGTGNPFKGLDSGSSLINTNTNWERPGDPKGEAKNYYLSSSAQGVIDSFNTIFQDITKAANSIAGAAISTQSLVTAGTGYVYQAQFDPINYWSGDVVPYVLTSNGAGGLALGSASEAPWRAAAELDRKDFTKRTIVIGSSDVKPSPVAMKFDWASVDFTVKQALRLAPGATVPDTDDVAAQERLNFLRGDRTQEGKLFRQRGSRLGDIVNSGIAFSGGPPEGVSDASYAKFKTDNANRPTTLFVGANDGMLHAFNSANNGDELFAYIPSWLTSKLTLLTSKTYNHSSYVDATPTVGEALIRSEWKTVLVGGTGAGGQGVYALDVTDPTAFDAGKVLWEFTDKHDLSLGNVVGKPQILKFRTSGPTGTVKYKYFAVVASGVNNYAADGYASPSGKPALFILDLEKSGDWALGDNYFKVEFPSVAASSPQGMINFSALTGSFDEVTSIYAGDLQGNLWKLDFTKVDSSKWTMDNLTSFKKNDGSASIPMFIAVDSGGKTQPISMSPGLAYGLNGTIVVLFGTGKYLETADIASPFQTQSFYALYDDVNPATPVDGDQAAIGGLGRLAKDTYSGGKSSGTSFIWGRPKSDTDLASRAGWYFEMPITGERQVSAFEIISGKFFAGSIIPTTDSCQNGTGNAYVIDIFTGGGEYFKTNLGISGQPLMIPVGLELTDNESTRSRNQYTTYRGVLTGSGGASVSLPYTFRSQTGRLSWRQLNNSK